MQNQPTNPTTNPNPAQPGYVTPKSATVAGILGIFLGGFGAHDWYLGNNKKGLLHVGLFGSGFLVAIIGACLAALSVGIPIIGLLFGLIAMLGYLVLIANGIWGLIEGIIILAQGDAGLAAKGYPIAVPQVYVQNPVAGQPVAQQPTQPAQPAQPTAAPAESEDKIAEAPAAKSEPKAAKDSKTTKKSDKKSA